MRLPRGRLCKEEVEMPLRAGQHVPTSANTDWLVCCQHTGVSDANFGGRHHLCRLNTKFLETTRKVQGRASCHTLTGGMIYVTAGQK